MRNMRTSLKALFACKVFCPMLNTLKRTVHYAPPPSWDFLKHQFENSYQTFAIWLNLFSSYKFIRFYGNWRLTLRARVWFQNWSQWPIWCFDFSSNQIHIRTKFRSTKTAVNRKKRVEDIEDFTLDQIDLLLVDNICRPKLETDTYLANKSRKRQIYRPFFKC